MFAIQCFLEADHVVTTINNQQVATSQLKNWSGGTFSPYDTYGAEKDKRVISITNMVYY